MSADINVESIVQSEVQAVLDLFDRLSDEGKRDVLARLTRREAASAKGAQGDVPDELDWSDLTEEDHDRLTAEAFAALDREEELARGDRRGPG